MFPLVLLALALVAATAILIFAKQEPTELDDETWDPDLERWRDQPAHRRRRDTFDEELLVMELEAEAAALPRT